MNLYKEINFQFIPDLIKWVKTDIGKRVKMENIKEDRRLRHDINPALLHEINKELNARGFPSIWYCQSYIRPGDQTLVQHVDGETYLVHGALNIPVSGTKNTKHTWQTGDYTLVPNTLHFSVQWNSDNRTTTDLELLTPCLVRVDAPHSVTGNGIEHRWIITIRFQGNPEFDDLFNLA